MTTRSGRATVETMEEWKEMMADRAGRGSSEERSRREREVERTSKLVVLKDDDDIESYLVTFERIMAAAHKVEKERWPHYLAPQLAGKAQLAFAALSITGVGEYKAIKEAILTRYNINEEAYRNRFRTEKRKEGETNREFSVIYYKNG